MARRLALLASESHHGAWSRASGAESAVRVRGLGADDSVWMTVIVPDSEIVIPLAQGEMSLLSYSPEIWTRYRVSKAAGKSGITTTVEVVLG